MILRPFLRRHFSQLVSKPAKLDYEVASKSLGKNLDKNLKTVAVFHGVLGNHKNLRQVSKKIVENLGGHQALLVTHRAHGGSESGEEPQTIKNCAKDAVHLFKLLGLETPRALIGHSLGGKVILEILNELAESGVNKLPEHVFILDSIPFENKVSSAKSDEGTVIEIIDKLLTVKQPFKSKEAMIHQLTKELHLPASIALWLTTSLSKTPRVSYKGAEKEGIFFAFDLEICKRLLEDFMSLDSSSIITDEKFKDVKFTLVRAGLNTSWNSPSVEERLKNDFGPKSNVEIVLMKNAGHWVHSDDPKTLVDIISSRLTLI